VIKKQLLFSSRKFSCLLSDSKDLEQLSAQDAEFTVFVPTDAAFQVQNMYNL